MNPNTEELTSDELEISEPLAARAPVDEESPTFAALGARPETVTALEAVGTTGRLLDLADQGHLELGKVGILVLDEADEMLGLGFLPDIEKILRLVPDERQTMLFSATMPGPIVQLARQFMNKPTHVRAED